MASNLNITAAYPTYPEFRLSSGSLMSPRHQCALRESWQMQANQAEGSGVWCLAPSDCSALGLWKAQKTAVSCLGSETRQSLDVWNEATIAPLKIVVQSLNVVHVCLQPPQQAQPAPGTMYVRIKRQKATYFIHVDPSDTVANLKLEVSKLTQQVSTHVWPAHHTICILACGRISLPLHLCAEAYTIPCKLVTLHCQVCKACQLLR